MLFSASRLSTLHSRCNKLLLLILAAAFLQFGFADQVKAASETATGSAASLLEKHAALATQLARNVYQRPLVIESVEGTNSVNGNAYAVLESPFTKVSTTLNSPAQWCEVLILHLNTKYCRAATDAGPDKLAVKIGRKIPQQLKDASSLEFNYRLVAASPDYLSVRMNSEKGPLGTSNYRIELHAIPLPDGRTFMHLGYSYDFGFASRMAMQAYLGTLGSGKVGFTRVSAAQKTEYVGGVRGAVERNTMRYYLAIEAYLASLGLPVAQQVDQRLHHWFDATEKYRLQLHEVEKEEYLAMKREEIQRQKSQPPS